MRMKSIQVIRALSVRAAGRASIGVDGPSASTSDASGVSSMDVRPGSRGTSGAYATAATRRDHHARCAAADSSPPAMRQRQVSS